MARFAVSQRPVDAARGYLYVSYSQSAASGASIFRFELASGKGGPWCRAPMQFANGMAMAPDGSGLYVVESDAPQVSFVPIASDGAAGDSFGWSAALASDTAVVGAWTADLPGLVDAGAAGADDGGADSGSRRHGTM